MQSIDTSAEFSKENYVDFLNTAGELVLFQTNLWHTTSLMSPEQHQELIDRDLKASKTAGGKVKKNAMQKSCRCTLALDIRENIYNAFAVPFLYPGDPNFIRDGTLELFHRNWAAQTLWGRWVMAQGAQANNTHFTEKLMEMTLLWHQAGLVGDEVLTYSSPLADRLRRSQKNTASAEQQFKATIEVDKKHRTKRKNQSKSAEL